MHLCQKIHIEFITGIQTMPQRLKMNFRKEKKFSQRDIIEKFLISENKNAIKNKFSKKKFKKPKTPSQLIVFQVKPNFSYGLSWSTKDKDMLFEIIVSTLDIIRDNVCGCLKI